jgi:putative ABC transport system permease protein
VQVDIGRGITYDEVRRHMPVAFIGNDIFTRFFEGQDPLGKTIAIEGNPYEVVGVARRWAASSANSQDNFVMIPIESYFKTYGNRNGIRLVAKAIDQPHLIGGAGRSARAAALLSPSAARPGRQLQHFRLGDHRHALGVG